MGLTTATTQHRYAVALVVLVAAVVAGVAHHTATSAVLPGDHDTVADGAVPAGVTVFDDEHPGVVNLDPELLQALRAAARDAGIAFYVNSGWRSSRYQEQLLREAVDKYGSLKEASRWVATPAKSAHVSGDAVDLGRTEAIAWLSERGFQYGLCQTYANEPWHYEFRPEAIMNGCPPPYADPTQDPRIQS